ncbi:MAG: SLC13 family permease [Kiloniellales bacterium]|nr:SLC13 family permease [Kiloniellales bacterium]
MELLFLALLILLMAAALGMGYPVAFALPGSAILTIGLAAGAGYLFAGDTDAYFAQGGPGQWLSAGVTNLRGVYWEAERDTLIAIPLFIFMGIMLQRSKIAEDLLVTMAQLFGPIPGGLGISVVFVGALLAATTGIVGATVVAMGLISLPAMLRNNYSHSVATGTIAASGTLGQIIPPSIVLIILADQLASATDQASASRKALYKESTGELTMPSAFDVSSTSAGEMFLGAFLPGLVLVGLYMAFILCFALFRPHLAPTVPYDGRFDRQFFGKVALILIPPLTLIFLVLGSILTGIATVNQAGAIGAAGALIMAGYRLTEGRPGAFRPAILAVASLVVIGVLLSFYEINVKKIRSGEDAFAVAVAAVAVTGLLTALVWSGWRALKVEDTLQGVMIETAKTTSLVFIILLGAAMLTAAFRAFGGEELVREFLGSLPGGFWTQFVIVMLVIFILGFFLDFIEIAVVVVPIVAPILLADPSANVTAVWLGVMIGLNIQTSFLTPPFGFALFYLRGVAPAIVKTISMYKGVIAFIALQLFALVVVGLYPNLVNYLPQRVSLTSETAPPPRNPKLQQCLEKYVWQRFTADGDAIRAEIAEARGFNLDYLPERLAKNLRESFDQAEQTFGLLEAARQAEEAVQAKADAFRPVQRKVRSIENGLRRLDAEIRELNTALRRTDAATEGARRERLEARIAALTEEREALAGEIPETWAETYKAFSALLKEESKARNLYRRNADRGYEPARALLAVFDATPAFKELGPELDGIKAKVAAAEKEEAAAILAALAKRFGEVDGASEIKTALTQARRAVRARTPDPEKAEAEMDKALAAYNAQIAWRDRAALDLVPDLRVYEVAIRDTIGARLQTRMSEDQALFVAGCNAGHRDISLYF